MTQLTITVRDGADFDMLSEIAERDWRSVEQQASALLEQALNTRRKLQRSGDRPIAPRGRRVSNGAAA